MNSNLDDAFHRGYEAGGEGLNEGDLLIYSNAIMEAHNKVKASKIIKPNLSLEMWHEKEHLTTITILTIDKGEKSVHYKVGERMTTANCFRSPSFEGDLHQIAQGHLPTKFVIKNDDAIDVFEYDTWVKRKMRIHKIKESHGVEVVGVKRKRVCDNCGLISDDVSLKAVDIHDFQCNIFGKFDSLVCRFICDDDDDDE